MITEEVYYWQIQWAGRWMTTFTRFTEQAIRKEHPEAIRIEGSRQVCITPETPSERNQARSSLRNNTPDVRYNLTSRA
ncbi:MAG: hypothetical protein WCK83_09565 [Burkholderiales bacterium]